MSEQEAWEELREILIKFFGGWHKVNEWLSASNHALGGVSPNDMINAGKADKLLAWMKQQIAFNANGGDK